MEAGSHESKTNTIGGGFGLFFDAAYAEIGVGIDFARFRNPDNSAAKGSDMAYFSISLLGKYPIALSEKLTLFPLLGFDWNIFLSGKSGDTDVNRDDLADMIGDDYVDSYDAFLIDLGVGADFALTDALYLRASFLYGFKLNSKMEQEYVDDMDAKVFTSGPTLKVGVGYKF
jgi:opacity protein-like surface antigen